MHWFKLQIALLLQGVTIPSIYVLLGQWLSPAERSTFATFVYSGKLPNGTNLRNFSSWNTFLLIEANSVGDQHFKQKYIKKSLCASFSSKRSVDSTRDSWMMISEKWCGDCLVCNLLNTAKCPDVFMLRSLWLKSYAPDSHITAPPAQRQMINASDKLYLLGSRGLLHHRVRPVTVVTNNCALENKRSFRCLNANIWPPRPDIRLKHFHMRHHWRLVLDYRTCQLANSVRGATWRIVTVDPKFWGRDFFLRNLKQNLF